MRDLKYIIKKTHIINLKPQIVFFFSEAFPLRNQITNKNTDNSAT